MARLMVGLTLSPAGRRGVVFSCLALGYGMTYSLGSNVLRTRGNTPSFGVDGRKDKRLIALLPMVNCCWS